MGIKAEKYYPITLAAILTFICFWQQSYLPPIQKIINGVLDHIFDVYSILIGFLLTILTIVRSMEGKAMDAIRKEKDRFRQLVSYLICSISLDSIMILFCLVLPFFPTGNAVIVMIVNYIFIFLLLFSLLTSYRFLDIFFTIFRVG